MSEYRDLMLIKFAEILTALGYGPGDEIPQEVGMTALEQADCYIKVEFPTVFEEVTKSPDESSLSGFTGSN